MNEAISPSTQRRSLAVKSDYAEAHNNLGLTLARLGKPDQAVASYDKAIAIDPGYAEPHFNAGNVHRDAGALEKAAERYRSALSIRPEYPEALNSLGFVLGQLGELDEAVASYDRALSLRPAFAVAHHNLGIAFRKLGDMEAAVASCRKALAIRPDFAEAHSSLAIALNACGQRSEALEHFKTRLEMRRGNNPVHANHISFRFINKAKMNHDIEQFHYLASLGHDTARFQALVAEYETVDEEIDWPSEDNKIVPLADNHRQRLAGTYNRPFHVLEAPEVNGSSLDGSLDAEEITSDYFTHNSGLTYFDNLLNPEALQSLHRYLLGSTFWFDFNYKGGYLGAMLRDGLACPLLLQIADDLRKTLPDIFKDHQLLQLWAYKYDSKLTGINLHADFAAVNVNFWLTPNTANLDPDSGGLVVYDAEAPLDWNFKAYNTSHDRIREFITEKNSGKTVVPHGENRIVLFNSNLFHKTDTINFKPGYENRRINVTMLFGTRMD